MNQKHARWLLHVLVGALAAACGSSGPSTTPPLDDAATIPRDAETVGSAATPATRGRLPGSVSRAGLAATPTHGNGHPAVPLDSNSYVPMNYGGGRVISNAKPVAVFWGSSVDATVQAQMPAFYAAVVNSPYIDWLAEYNTPAQGICRGTYGGNFTITPTHAASTLSEADVENELAAQITSGGLPTPDDDTVYMVHFPPGIALVDDDGFGSCSSWCGEHGSFASNAHQIRFAMLPDLNSGGCAGVCGPAGTVFNNETTTASHELMEIVTDPDPFTGWSNTTGSGEIGDPCAYTIGYQATLPGTSFVVQTLWSNTVGDCILTPPGGTRISVPQITSITPKTALYTSTTPVVINGTCLAGVNYVTFAEGTGTAAPSFTVNSGRQISLTAPAAPDGAIGVASVTLFNSDGFNSASTPFTYISSGLTISPTSGPTAGGTIVTITGDGLAPYPATVTVSFGGIAAPQAAYCATAGSCIVPTPAHAAGSAPVVVTINGVPQSANPFTYQGPIITSMSPPFGPVTGGTYVDLLGSDFSATMQVFFNGVASDYVVCQSNAWCTVRTPPGAAVGNANVTIQLADGTPSIANPPADVFTYEQYPRVVWVGLTSGYSTLVGGQVAQAGVALNGYAPPGGAVVALAVDKPAELGLPSPATVTVTVPAGSSGDFNVTALAQDITDTVVLSASYQGTSASALLTINPTPAPTLAPISQSCSAQTLTETITLAEPAPPSGGTVSLMSDNPVATVLATIPVAAGATTATFNVVIGTAATAQTVHLSATYDGVAANTVTFTVLPAAALALTLPASVTTGATATGTVTLCSPAPVGGAAVNVTSNNGVATPTTPVTVTAGNTSAPVVVATGFTSTVQSATITATYQGASASSVLTVRPVPHCGAGTMMCTCSDGRHACERTAQACFTFCTGG